MSDWDPDPRPDSELRTPKEQRGGRIFLLGMGALEALAGALFLTVGGEPFSGACWLAIAALSVFAGFYFGRAKGPQI
jgi:hypothetical protein